MTVLKGHHFATWHLAISTVVKSFNSSNFFSTQIDAIFHFITSHHPRGRQGSQQTRYLISNSKSQINEAQKQISFRATKSSKSNYLPRHSSIWNSLTRHSSNRNSLTRHSPTWYSLPWHLSTSDNFLPKYSDFLKFPSYTLRLAHKTSRKANRPDGHKTPVKPIVSKDIKRLVGPIVPKDIKRPVRPTILKDIKLLQAILFG